MPLREDPLSEDEISALETWISQGAPWDRHWAYVPPQKPDLPDVNHSDWPENGLDFFVLSRLEDEGLTVSPEADCFTLARRVSLDIVGIPPSLPEVEQLCAEFSDNAYSAYVETLLASPHFGERWAAVWLDLARYADTKGYEKDPSRTIWKYRDWVIGAFNADKPFDQFTVEQLAGDLLPSPTRDQLIATAFHRNTMTNTEGGTRDEEFRIAAVMDRVNTTMEVWQATSMQCVQCHGHPYDPFRHQDYYGLLAVFNNTQDADLASEEPNLVTFSDPATETRSKRYRDRIDTYRQQIGEQAQTPEFAESLEEWVTTARQQLASSEGRTLVGLKEIPPESEIERIIKESAEREMNAHERWQLVEYYKSVAPQLESLRKKLKTQEKYLERLKPIRTPIMRELPPQNQRTTFLFKRGNWLTPGTPVTGKIPPGLGSVPEDKPIDRLALARWLVSDSNPLTARVTVNRFWHQIFGTGIVETVEDFGTRGAPPSHPRLLDWLARTFVEDYQWSIKSLLKLLVTSATYRQSSQTDDLKSQQDPYNRLLSRGPRFRLSAEQVRDQALAVSGLLSPKMYGPSVMPAQPEGIWNSPYSNDRWSTSRGEDRYRRGIYTFWKRTSPYPSMEVFDKPSQEVTVSRRISTNTPLQALVTLNDPVFVEIAVGLANRMNTELEGDPDERIRRGYQLALLRPPDEDTVQTLLRLYEESHSAFGDEPEQARRLVRVLKAGAPGDPRQLATLSMVAQAILNLDEFLTKN